MPDRQLRFSGSDGPYRLVSENDFAEFFSVKVEEAFLDLGFYYFEEATVFALFENFTDAKNGGEVIVKGETHFLTESFRSFAVVLTTFRVAEDHIGSACRGNHRG